MMAPSLGMKGAAIVAIATATILPLLIMTPVAATAIPCKCKNLTIPLQLEARNGKFNLNAPGDNMDVTNFILNSVRPGRNYTADILEDIVTVSGLYHIKATYCKPTSKGPTPALQILTHGIGFDRGYWDPALNGWNYSYVDQALARGYATLAHDRLGIGGSSRGDAVSVVQAWLEMAALRKLTARLRAGKLVGITDTFDKIVHVGHSFGSVQTYGLVAGSNVVEGDGDDEEEEDVVLSDGIVLTGFSMESAYVPYFALGGNFVQANTLDAFATYPDGYLASADSSAVQANFFAQGQFDPDMLAYAVDNGQPVSVGELLTLPGPVSTANTFEGPVLVITGNRDVPFCGGNCTVSVPSFPLAAKKYFTNTSHFEAFIVPGAGHGLNLEYSWPTTYATILDFIDKHVLGK